MNPLITITIQEKFYYGVKDDYTILEFGSNSPTTILKFKYLVGIYRGTSKSSEGVVNGYNSFYLKRLDTMHTNRLISKDWIYELMSDTEIFNSDKPSHNLLLVSKFQDGRFIDSKDYPLTIKGVVEVIREFEQLPNDTDEVAVLKERIKKLESNIKSSIKVLKGE